MSRIIFLLLFSCSLIALDKPNIIIILTDDLGWGDVSYHGGPIPTPNIDKLAKKGLEMNRFYSALTVHNIIRGYSCYSLALSPCVSAC